ncbi:hypothetical protein P7B04_07090 [Sphingobium yanoikuyae]|uniref:hypothetical protein n=1 Tax=Sphingobium yanoikuyae TaxID=13690 RepID=UPI00240FD9B9|nr:hypothetical protein [Sphingobium yanoikuyae]MDG2512461.1 hypothetical protein [Sphingobium yanoikuyae]
MSGFMRKAALVVGAVALVAATAGAAAPLLAPGIGGVASIAGVSAATLTAIGTYGGLAAGVLTAISTATAPGMSSQGSQTSFTTNPQSGLPYAMGRTRMSGLRIYANTNTRPGYTKFNDLLWFGALLSVGGAIGGIEKFTADNEIVSFDASGNAIGDYHDYQAQKIHLGGQQTSALALTLGGGSAPGWTTAHKLSGITDAMWCLRYNKQGEMYGAGAPEPAWIGNWVKVYDPRLDSTYPGGSGSCRALVESTYVWSDNPGLHALTWALGRWQNGKRTCGIGAPVANIRVAEFVECANVCEANGWKVGGVEWTTDSKWDTLKRILQAGGAIPTQTGAMVGCLVSTPRTAIATIESRHLLDSLSIAATKSRRDRFNSVIPRYVDEDSDWSVISGIAITVSDYVTADKGERTKEIDYPLVQVFSGDEATQPGQLAAYDIVNSREAGPINFTTGPEWIGLKTGDVILLNVPEEGLVNQPVLITRRAPDPSTGKVAFSAQTETYAKHAYALGQSTTPPAPFSLTAPDLKPPAPAAANWAAAGTVTGEGLPAIVVTGNSEMPSADAVLIDYKLPADATWTRSAILSANEPVQHVIAPLQSETAYQVRVGYRVEQIDGEFTILAAVTTGAGIISGISDTIGEQRDELDQLQLDTAAAAAAAAAAQSQIAAIEGSVTTDIGALADQIGSVSASVGELVLEVGAVATDVSALTDNVGTIAADLVALSSQVGTVAIDVDGLKADILAAGGAIASLESNVSTQGASIATLQQATSSIGGDLATLTTRVTAGSANLLRTGGLDAGTLDWSSEGTLSLAYSASFGRWLRVTSEAANFFINSTAVQVDPGGAYTASVDTIFQASAGTMIASLVWLNSGGAEVGRVWAGNRGGHSFDNINAGRATNAASGIAPANASSALLQVSWNNVAGLVNAGLRQAKIENYPTWTPFSSEASIRSAYTAISTLDTQYAGLSTTVGTQGASIVQNATAITNLTGRTASLESSVSAQGASIVTLQQATSTQGGQIAQLTTDLSTANANIGINATAISTTNSNLAQLTTRVGSAESAVSQNATAISGLNGRTASLESNVSTQGASIATLQQATSSIGGDLATLTTRVTAGSANLLRTGGLDAGTLDWATNGVLSLEYSASFGRWLRVTSGAANFFINSLSVQVDPGGAYTASVDTIFEASAGTMIASLVWLNSSGAEVGRVWAGNRGGHSFDNSNAGRATNAASGIAPANAAGALLQVSWNNVAGLVNAGLRQAKIENYTTWTPFSSEASIRSAYTAISTLDTQYAGLSTTVGTQGASIVQNATAITNLTGRTASLESNVSAQGASIVTLQQATSTQGGQIAQLTTDLSTANANIGINATAISTTNTNLAQLTTRVGSAESAVSQNATAISGLNGRTASLESSVSTQGASIATLQQATSTIGGDLATLTTRVTAGSANLLRTGGLDAGTLDWSSEGTLSLAYSASFGRWLRVTSGAANFFINSTAVQVDPGGAYTASVDTIFQASAGTMIASLVWLNSGGTEVGRALGGNRGGHSFDNSNAGRATNAASGIAPANASSALLQVSWNNVAGLVNAGLRQAKIENYTTWTPFSSEASIRSAYTAISMLDTQYAGLSTTVGTQGASIAQNATAITNLTGRTASLESNVSAQGASIVTLQQATSIISGDVASLTTRVTASAPNLLPQGGFANGMADWGNPAGWTSSSALDPNWGRYVSVNATGNTYAGTPVQPAQPNQQYTISADIDRGGTSGGAVFARIVWTQAGNVHSIGPMAVKYAGGFSNDEAARVWGTGACPSDANGFYVQLGVEGVTGYQHFRRIKVNVGNYPARFTEEAGIVQSFQALSTLTTQYASLSSTVATQGASISSQATAITTLNGNVATLFAKWSLELDVNGYVSGMVTNNNGTRADMTLRMDKVKMVTPSGLGGYWQVTFDSQGRPTQTIGDDASGVTIEIGYLA